MSTIIERNNFLPHINSSHRTLEAFRLLSSQAFPFFVTRVLYQRVVDSSNCCCVVLRVCVGYLQIKKSEKKCENKSPKNNICTISFIKMLQQTAHVKLSTESTCIQVHKQSFIATAFCMWSWEKRLHKAIDFFTILFSSFVCTSNFYTKVKH